jgi:hypothetical protein
VALAGNLAAVGWQLPTEMPGSCFLRNGSGAFLLLCKIARSTLMNAAKAAKYPSYSSLGARTRRLIERVSATLQFRNSNLMLRYLQDCPPRL